MVLASEEETSDDERPSRERKRRRVAAPHLQERLPFSLSQPDLVLPLGLGGIPGSSLARSLALFGLF